MANSMKALQYCVLRVNLYRYNGYQPFASQPSTLFLPLDTVTRLFRQTG